MGGHYFTQRNGTCGMHWVAPLIVLQAEQCEVAMELQRGNETKDNHVHLETKNNHMHLRVRALRDDSRVEHLFPSIEYQHHSEATAEPSTKLHLHSSSSKTEAWRSVCVQ